MTLLMREIYSGRPEPTWLLREPAPYFTEGPYMSYHKAPPFSYGEGPAYSSYPDSPFRDSPFRDSPPRPIRATSSIPAYSLYTDSPFPDLPPRPIRATSSIPAYNHYSESPFSDSPTRIARSSSSITKPPRETRESRPREQKVPPEIELRVEMCCSKCEEKVRDALQKVEGVTGVKTDRHAGKATVSGKVDPQVVLKKVQKIKKKTEFWSKQIYSQAFIDFIQSKTGRQPEEEVTSSFSQHGSSDSETESLHDQHEREHMSSYREYPPSYSGRDLHDSYDQMAKGPSYSPPFAREDAYHPYGNVDRGSYYNQYTPSYGGMSNFSPYGAARRSSYSHIKEPFEERSQGRRYEDHSSAHYDPFEPSYGALDSHPYYERDSRSSFGDYTSGYGESSSYRPSQSYGPSGIANPNYMKRVISDY